MRGPTVGSGAREAAYAIADLLGIESTSSRPTGEAGSRPLGLLPLPNTQTRHTKA